MNYNKIFKVCILIIILLPALRLNAGLLINEIACATAGEDWVELRLYSDTNQSLDISGLFVTMYYGTNERLSIDPVTIYSYDRPETPYDDRFVLVHLTAPGIPDETDLTGDTNGNGYLDVYCNNYSSSLWNSDCVVAIDTDDDPANGRIIDFVAYSNRDGSLNDFIGSCVAAAQANNQWIVSGNIQDSMIDIGKNGLDTFMTISRKNVIDTNSQDDFEITKFMTPGKENLFSGSASGNRDIFNIQKDKITVSPSDFSRGGKDIELFVLELCNIRVRIFSSIGILIYESDLHNDVHPGSFKLNWNLKGLGKTAGTGLYFALIEATSSQLKKSQNKTVYMIISRYKQ